MIDAMRFGGIERLYGDGVLQRLANMHVAVVGLGGVGSWAVEALARSGVGQLTLIDLDDVCVTNVNRQVHALEGTIGLPKTTVLAKRINLINPACRVQVEETFFTANNAEQLLSQGFDYVIDAIDSMQDKCVLVSECQKRQMPLVVSGGVGGKRDPASVKVAELRDATNDPLLKRLRRRLRQDFGYSRDLKQPLGCQAVYSTENPIFPWSDGRVCVEPEANTSLTLDCASGFGTAGFLTGTFGFAAASVVVQSLLGS